MTPLDTFLLFCHEVTEFCLKNANRKCFNGWSREKIFLYVGGNCIAGNLFISDCNDKVQAIAIAKPTGEGRLLFFEVIGNRALVARMFSQMKAKWPDIKRIFAFRHYGNAGVDIVEFSPETVARFCGLKGGLT